MSRKTAKGSFIGLPSAVCFVLNFAGRSFSTAKGPSNGSPDKTFRAASVRRPHFFSVSDFRTGMSRTRAKLKTNNQDNVVSTKEEYRPSRATIRDCRVQSRLISSSLGPRARSISSSEADPNVCFANSVRWYPTETYTDVSRDGISTRWINTS